MKTVTIKVEVTDKDIRKGNPFVSSMCPIALALNRATGKEYRVGFTSVYQVNDVAEQTRGYLPKVACDFVKKLMKKEKVKPITFTIDLPMESLNNVGQTRKKDRGR